jgi:methyl-accepting chemotaxis protein
MRDEAQQVRRAMAEQSTGAKLIAQAGEASARFADDVNRSSQEVVALSDRVVGEVESIRQTVRGSTETAMKMNGFVEKFSATSQRMKESLALFRL